MTTYTTSMRRKKAYTFFLQKVLSDMNKTGHFTKAMLVS